MVAWLNIENEYLQDIVYLASLGKNNLLSWEWYSDYLFINWQAFNIQITAWPKWVMQTNNAAADWE